MRKQKVGAYVKKPEGINILKSVLARCTYQKKQDEQLRNSIVRHAMASSPFLSLRRGSQYPGLRWAHLQRMMAEKKILFKTKPKTSLDR